MIHRWRPSNTVFCMTLGREAYKLVRLPSVEIPGKRGLGGGGDNPAERNFLARRLLSNAKPNTTTTMITIPTAAIATTMIPKRISWWNV